MRLENLGYLADAFDDRRAAFASEFGVHASTPLSDFAKDVDQWHKTGNPSHIRPDEEEPHDLADSEEVDVEPDPNFTSGGEEDYDNEEGDQ